METELIPALFKYNSLISAPLFSVIALFLIRKIPHFSYTQRTVSQSIHFLSPTQKIVFKVNFILKSLLDVGFAWYVLTLFDVPLHDPLTWILLLSTSSFGLLAYFTEDTHKPIHRMIIYSIIALSTIAQVEIARLTENIPFMQLTSLLALIQLVVAFGFLAIQKTNTLVQLACAMCAYMWLIVFAWQY